MRQRVAEVGGFFRQLVCFLVDNSEEVFVRGETPMSNPQELHVAIFFS